MAYGCVASYPAFPRLTSIWGVERLGTRLTSVCKVWMCVERGVCTCVLMLNKNCSESAARMSLYTCTSLLGLMTDETQTQHPTFKGDLDLILTPSGWSTCPSCELRGEEIIH